jgi:TolB-like protein
MRIKFITLLASMMVAAFASARAESPLTVAVYDFTDAEKGAGNYGGKVTALVTADLTEATNLVMLERAELNKALQEQAFGVSGLVSADAAAKIGDLTGAKVLVAGQVIKSGENLIIIADIIGTETGRLFAEKVQGRADALADLTADLSGKIAREISEQASNLVALPVALSSDNLQRAIKNLPGTNRPSVSIKILYTTTATHGRSAQAENELGRDLMAAGFTIVEESSNRKPDVDITGAEDMRAGVKRGVLFSFRCNVELKVTDRRTGEIITMEHQESSASDTTKSSADHAAQTFAAEQLAEKIMPPLSQWNPTK